MGDLKVGERLTTRGFRCPRKGRNRPSLSFFGFRAVLNGRVVPLKGLGDFFCLVRCAPGFFGDFGLESLLEHTLAGGTAQHMKPDGVLAAPPVFSDDSVAFLIDIQRVHVGDRVLFTNPHVVQNVTGKTGRGFKPCHNLVFAGTPHAVGDHESAAGTVLRGVVHMGIAVSASTTGVNTEAAPEIEGGALEPLGPCDGRASTAFLVGGLGPPEVAAGRTAPRGVGLAPVAHEVERYGVFV